MGHLRSLVLAACAAVLAGWWLSRSDATEDERARPLPGDELVPHPPVIATRVIGIRAAPEAVWPWLVQIGQGRAGFYSHAWLENLLGCSITNAERIVPEWQSLAVGDEIAMHPSAPKLVVRAVEPGRSLVLGEPNVFSWAFVLEPAAPGTRLIVRTRGSFGLPALAAPLLEPAHGVMERSMLRGIRTRAEGAGSAAWRARE